MIGKQPFVSTAIAIITLFSANAIHAQVDTIPKQKYQQILILLGRVLDRIFLDVP